MSTGHLTNIWRAFAGQLLGHSLLSDECMTSLLLIIRPDGAHLLQCLSLCHSLPSVTLGHGSTSKRASPVMHLMLCVSRLKGSIEGLHIHLLNNYYVVAGPNRPVPKEATTSSIVNGQWQSQLQSRAQALANQASKTGASLYNNLTSAVGERG